MNKSKLACLITCLFLCLAMFSGLIAPAVASAQSEEQAEEDAPPPEEKIELETKYPVLSASAGEAFNFEVEIMYEGEGDEPHYFDLSVEGPEDWLIYLQKGKYETEKISAIRLAPRGFPEKIMVIAMAPPWAPPEPGEYTIKLKVAERESGEPRNSFDLTAKITARYDFVVETATGRLNTKATAGKESHFSITVTNIGTATLDKITFSSSKPSGIAGEEWSVSFNPEKVEALDPLEEKKVEVTIKPPSKTIAGDYPVILKFDGEPASHADDLNIRVAVGTSTKWGWIGVGIVVAVIVGLVVGFRQWGRR